MTLRSTKSLRPALLVVVFLALSACADQYFNPSRVELFNGENLDNWRQVGAASWQVHEGQISVADSAGDGMLVSREKCADFKLSLEFWVDEKVNSGVFIRCADTDEFTPFNCYEMNIWDRHPKQAFRTGAIVTLVSPPLAHVTTVNKWNTYEIVAEGSQFTVKVNGKVTARLKDDKHRKGYIALQRANDGNVRFRNIVLELL